MSNPKEQLRRSKNSKKGNSNIQSPFQVTCMSEYYTALAHGQILQRWDWRLIVNLNLQKLSTLTGLRSLQKLMSATCNSGFTLECYNSQRGGGQFYVTKRRHLNVLLDH